MYSYHITAVLWYIVLFREIRTHRQDTCEKQIFSGPVPGQAAAAAKSQADTCSGRAGVNEHEAKEVLDE